MMTATTDDLLTTLAALPKIELHRHLEGSVRLKTLAEIAKEYKIDLPTYDPEGLRKYVQVMPDEPANATQFLAKFGVLRRFYRSPEIIQRVVNEAIEDAANDNIKYMELRFTPKALSKLMDYSFDQVMRWVIQAMEEAQKGKDIAVRLIISMNRHEGIKEAERAVDVALANKDRGVVAIDLAGQEVGYPAEPFFPVFAKARQAGLFATVHAGEWSGPRNIREAIEKMGATRIGHGVRIVEDSMVAQVVRESGATFEVCITSNVQSGAVRAIEQHPLQDMTFLGLKTTLNTDDPSVSNTTLTQEFAVAVKKLGLSMDYIKKATLNAAQCAFLPDAERSKLVADFTARFAGQEQKP